jgi:putative transposase
VHHRFAPLAAHSRQRAQPYFDPEQADRVWAGDVTYIATEEGWLFLAVILDLFSRRVVGWSVSDANDTKLASETLRHGWVARRPEAGLLHHTIVEAPTQPLPTQTFFVSMESLRA